MAWCISTEACRQIHLAKSLFWLCSAVCCSITMIITYTINYINLFHEINNCQIPFTLSIILHFTLYKLPITCFSYQLYIFNWWLSQPMWGWGCGLAPSTSNKYIAVDKWHCHIANSIGVTSPFANVSTGTLWSITSSLPCSPMRWLFVLLWFGDI